MPKLLKTLAVLALSFECCFDHNNLVQAQCDGSCGNDNTVSNNRCNDVNNNCGCGWDGGDCCGDTGDAGQYNTCALLSDGTCCLDPGYIGTTTGRRGGDPGTRATTTAGARATDASTTPVSGRPDATEATRGPIDEETRAAGSTTSRRSGGLPTTTRRGRETTTTLDEATRGGEITARTTSQLATRPGDDTTTPISGRPDLVTDATRDNGNDATRGDGSTTSRRSDAGCRPDCDGNEANLNNGKCNAVNNNCGCDWDGGDCCGDSGQADQYASCPLQADGTCCLDPDYIAVRTTDTTTRAVTTTEAAVTRGPPDVRTTATVVRPIDSTSTAPFTGRPDVTEPQRETTTPRTRAPGSTTARQGSYDCLGATCAGNVDHIGNGKCNNANNNCACSWDGGDCCGSPTTADQYDSCTVNEDGDCCLDPTFRGASSTTRAGPNDRTTAPNPDIRTVPDTTTATGRQDITDPIRSTVPITRPDDSTTGRQGNYDCSGSTCQGNEGNIGNGKCNNVNNNCACSWDGGDCCGAAATQAQYSSCTINANGDCCLDPTFRGGSSTTTRGGPNDRTTAPNPDIRTIPDTTAGGTGRQDITDPLRSTVPLTRPDGSTTGRQGNYDCSGSTCQGNENNIGNGKCNNVNNNCACSWDGGDCCGPAATQGQYSSCTIDEDGDCCLDPTFRAGTTGVTTTTTTTTTSTVTTVTTVDTTTTTTKTTMTGSSSSSTTSPSDSTSSTADIDVTNIYADVKFMLLNGDSCTKKFSCLGTTCDNILSRIKPDVDYTFLETKYGCDCSGCGSNVGISVGIPGMA